MKKKKIVYMQTAEKWKLQYNSNIIPEIISSSGRREDSVKFEHCEQYELKNFLKSKGYQTCPDFN